jgi:tRNA(fMet)-specific endonuclease VapC
MYILDTNTLIYFFKGLGGVAETLFSKEPANIGIPAIVIYKIQTGIAKSTSPRKRTQQLKSLTEAVAILPFSTEEAKASATIRSRLEQKGTPIGHYDVLIAGTAMARKGVLVTHNLTEFKRVKGLKTEDWF